MYLIIAVLQNIPSVGARLHLDKVSLIINRYLIHFNKSEKGESQLKETKKSVGISQVNLRLNSNLEGLSKDCWLVGLSRSHN